MGEYVYESLAKYYHALENTGYMSYPNVVKLLILAFYKDFVYHDYRAVLSKNDYRLIERALDCLYGTSCLISYPDYLKMGKLYLGQMTEMAERVKTLENTSVLKLIHNLDEAEGTTDSDVLVMADED